MQYPVPKFIILKIEMRQKIEKKKGPQNVIMANSKCWRKSQDLFIRQKNIGHFILQCSTEFFLSHHRIITA